MESTTNVSVSDQAGQEQLTFLDLRGASDADLALLQRILTHSCKVQLPVCEKPEQPVPETCRLPPDGTEYDADEAVPRAAESPPPPQPPPPPQQPQPQQQQQQRQRTPIVPPTNQPGLAGEMPSTSPSAMPTMSAPHQMMAHMMHGGAPMFHPQAAPGYYPGMFMPPGGNMMYQMSPAGYPMAPAGYGAPEPPAAAEQGDRRRSAGGKKGGDKQLSALAAPFPGPGFAMTPRAATGQPLMIQPFPGHPYGAQYAQYPYPLPYGYGGYATYPSGEMVLLPPPPPHHMQQHPMEMPVQPPPGAAEESRTPLCEPYGRAEEEDVPPVAEDAPAPEADADPAPAAELEPPPVSDSPSATAVSIAPSATAGRVETAAAVVPEPAPTGPVRLSFGFNLDHKLLIGENSAVQLETSGVTPEPTEERAGDGRSSSAEPTETAPPTSYVATVTVSQRRVIPPPEPVDFGPDSGRDSPDPLPEPDRLMGSPESEMMISPEPAAGTDSETAETPEPYPTNGASSPEPLPEPELDGIEELEAAAQAPAPVPAPAPAPAPAPVPAPAQPAARSWASLFSKKTEGAAPAPVAPATPKPAPAPPVPETDKEILALGEALARFELCHKTVYLQPRGLTNKSNWCYINAVLQALVSCTPFYHLMKSLPHNVGVLPDRSRTPIIDAMVEFIREFSPLPELPRISRRERERGQLRDIQHGAPFEPGYVYAMLSRVSSDAFRVAGRQEDAEEFLTCLLSGLQDEMTDVLKLYQKSKEEDAPPLNGAANGDARHSDDDDDGDSDDWQTIIGKNRGQVTRSAELQTTPISRVFSGQLRSALHRQGSKATATVQSFFSLQLDIQSPQVSSVEQALEALVERDPVVGLTCPQTGQPVDAYQQAALELTPPTLILHLKRFLYDPETDGVQKLLKRVTFPVDLELKKELLSNVRTKMAPGLKRYRLFAVVYHSGKESTKGHYITDAYHPAYQQWVRYDDSSISAVAESAVLRPEPPLVPYILFYRRVDTVGAHNGK
ncbi:ubiquitin carboxyl-terminal hydrolase 10-like isoform X2 [Amphibalanus amphitrite]|uniref:ubiquitin carboxyl-terminal hydrolase 10-like isoform X2 n=1 Tax=Amphibalanus amphitrite TaxID=1232801 RepID=UPI001C923FE5|nr:ubiquitin carboxyl-terminal hydrolase 10-like isoform X2 [Amphibalanus amphitrite]